MSNVRRLFMRGIGSFVPKHLVFVVYFIGCCAVAGIYVWYAKTASSAFLEAELAACIKKCSPFRAKLETTRQELAYQQRSGRGSAYKSPECKCVR
jgi:hypothetical protein